MSKDVPGSAPLRVALVTGNLNLGGASSLLLNLTGELNRRGIQTLVFSFEKENPLASDFKADGVEVVFEDEDKSIFRGSPFGLPQIARGIQAGLRGSLAGSTFISKCFATFRPES